MGLVTVLATLLNVAGIGCGVVSLATTSWVNPGVGLFQHCVQFITERCTITVGDDNIVLALICLLCFGLLISVPAVVLLFVDILRSSRRKGLIAGALLVIASILIAAGTTTYTILRKPTGVSSLVQAFGYSYYMAWGSCGSLFLAGILAFASSRDS